MDLSTRNTASRRLAELDSLYSWRTKANIKFTQVLQEGIGYKYKNHKALIMADENEIYIYKQTLKIDGVNKGLTLVTKNGNKEKVKKFFNDSIKKIKADEELKSKFIGTMVVPVELGIYYTY